MISTEKPNRIKPTNKQTNLKISLCGGNCEMRNKTNIIIPIFQRRISPKTEKQQSNA